MCPESSHVSLSKKVAGDPVLFSVDRSDVRATARRRIKSPDCPTSSPIPIMESLAESAGENVAIDEFNNYIGDHIGQKDPYKLKTPQGLSKRDAAVLRRCRRRAHQLDHNAVLCYCCPCFFGLNTALCMLPKPHFRPSTWNVDCRHYSVHWPDLCQLAERESRSNGRGSGYSGSTHC
jgi:hypothetical protein